MRRTQIQHPFIVRLHCAFHDTGRLYLLMDWHNGGHLLRLLQEQVRTKHVRYSQLVRLRQNHRLTKVVLALLHAVTDDGKRDTVLCG